MPHGMNILQASSPGHIAQARILFEEYAEWLKLDLTFQGFAAELENLPGVYAPPRGRLLLGSVETQLAGCIALRPLADECCEMKRLFVRPRFRGQHLGASLATQLIAEARAIGYHTMRLDTLARMQSAIRLYQSLGFTPCAPYYETPLPDTVFMELQL